MTGIFEVVLGRIRRVMSLFRRAPFDASTEVGRSQERYRRIALNTLSSFIARGWGMAVGLLTVPMALGYLGREQYGLWALITSLLTWMHLFNFGIANGLVNAISEANGKDDTDAAARYVSTAFFSLLAITLLLSLAFALLSPLVPWSDVLAAESVLSDDQVRWSVIAAAVPLLLAMPLSILPQIYAGYQKSYLTNIFGAIGAALTLGGLLIAIRMQASLPVLILIYSGFGWLASVINLGYLSFGGMAWLRPSLARVSGSAMRRLWRTSLPLFLFQIGALAVNQTQQMVLAHRASLGTVADYSVLMRVYILIISLIVMSSASFMPALREAFERGDRDWVRSGFRRLVIIRMSAALGGAAVLVLAGNWLLRVWLNRTDMQFGAMVWLWLAILLVSVTWVTAHSDFLMIMDRIWIQVALVLANGVTTVALALWLVPELGLVGAIMAISAVTVFVLTWLVPWLTRGLVAPVSTA